MPFVQVPSRGLNVYYTLNPTYTDDNLSMSFEVPPPPSQDISQLDDRPLLIFNHAATSSTHSFIYQFRDARLAAAVNLLSFDTRHYGWTTYAGERLDRYMNLEERADEMIDTIRALIGTRPFVIVGESFAGGHCGLYVAAKMGEQVQAMVLVSPGFVEDAPELCEVLETEWAPIVASNKFGNGDGTGRMPDAAMQIVSDYFFSGSTHEPERQQAFLNQYQAQQGPGQDMFKINQLLTWFRRKAPSPAMFEAVRIPVLLLGGTNDTTVAPEDALEQWYDLLVNVPEDKKRIERVHGGTHYLCTTDANLVNRFLLAFLKRHEII